MFVTLCMRHWLGRVSCSGCCSYPISVFDTRSRSDCWVCLHRVFAAAVCTSHTSPARSASREAEQDGLAAAAARTAVSGSSASPASVRGGQLGLAAAADADQRLSVDPMAAWRRPLWGRPAAPQSCLGCCAHVCVDVFCEHLRQQLEAASRVAGCRCSHTPVGVATGETFKGLWIA